MYQQNKAYLLALGTVLCWSTVASAFKISLRYLDVFQLLFYSSLFSTLVLFAVILAKGKLLELKGFNPVDWSYSILLGALNPWGYYLILFKAYDLLPAQEAQPLNYTWAITLSLMSVPILKQPLKAVDLISLTISYFGVYLILSRGEIGSFDFSHPFGVGLALGSTIIWSLYWICNTKDPLDPVCRLFLNFISGTVLVGISTALFSNFKVQSWAGLAGAAYIGIFEMGITFVLWSAALKLSRTAAQISIFIYLSPFLSLFFINKLVGEYIKISTIAGLFFIVSGICIQQFYRLKMNP